MFNKVEYQKKWYKEHRKKCLDCGSLIKFNSKRCKSCDAKERWRNNIFPPMKANSGSFKKGKRVSPATEFKKGFIPWNKNKPNLKIRGENHWNWKNGKTAKILSLRHSLEYKVWRRKILERDNFICQMCGQRGGRLQVDHIKAFALYPELRFKENNARTLCINCHRLTENYLSGAIKQKYHEYQP